jgi:hypothetical protein
VTEQRDYEKNGLGRRTYDNKFLEHCLSCDLRKEVKSKLSLKVFAIFISSLIALTGIAVTIAGLGARSMIETSKQTLEVVHQVSVDVATIQVKQQILIHQLHKDNNERDRTRPDHN